MKNYYRAKGIVIIIVLVIGILIGRWSDPHDLIKVESDERWCFYAEYGDMQGFQADVSHSKQFISFKGSRVQTFVPCDTIYENKKN